MTTEYEMNGTDLKIALARLDERLKALDREVQAAEKGSEKGLVLAAAELHRRLEILNGEAGRLREMQATYVPRETFDRFRESVDDKARMLNEVVDRRLKALETDRAAMSGRQLVLSAVWAVVVLIMAAVISAVLPGIILRVHP